MSAGAGRQLWGFTGAGGWGMTLLPEPLALLRAATKAPGRPWQCSEALRIISHGSTKHRAILLAEVANNFAQ